MVSGKITPATPGYYMLWLHASGVDPFSYFNDKYGYKPKEISIGNDVVIDIPEGVRVAPGVFTPRGHIKLR